MLKHSFKDASESPIADFQIEREFRMEWLYLKQSTIEKGHVTQVLELQLLIG